MSTVTKTKTYEVSTFWTCSAIMEVEADSLEEAMQYAKEMDLPPVEQWHYVSDSFEVDREHTEMINEENGNSKD